MSFIDMAMDDVREKGMAPEARYDLVVVSAKVGDTKAGDRKKLSVVIDILGGEFEPIFETFVFPNKKDKEENEGRNNELFILSIKRFLYLFGIPWEASGWNLDTLSGATAENILVSCQKGDDGVERNKITYPRLPEGS